MHVCCFSCASTIFRYRYLKIAGRLMRKKKCCFCAAVMAVATTKRVKRSWKKNLKEKNSEINPKCCFCASVMTVATTEQVVKRKKKKKLRARSKDFPPRRAKTGVFSFFIFSFLLQKKEYTYMFFLYRRARTVGRTPTYVSA